MGKITVKRFFNKKLKPIEIYDDLELGYPLYYSITYNRKTQHIKSLCGAVMTEKAFNHLERTNEPFNYETNYQITEYEVSLKHELFLIKKATELIIENEKQENILNPEFIPRLKEYFKNLQEALYFQGWLDNRQNAEPRTITTIKKVYTGAELLKIKPKEKDVDFDNIYLEIENKDKIYFLQKNFYNCFNRDKNLLFSLDILKKITKTDLSRYIYVDTLKFWQVINLIELAHKEDKLLIQFAINFDTQKYIELNKIKQYNITNEEIILISKKLKNRVLNISHFE